MLAWAIVMGLSAFAVNEEQGPLPPTIDELQAVEPEQGPASGDSSSQGEPVSVSTENPETVISPTNVALLYGGMLAPVFVAGCAAGLSPFFLLFGPQAFLLTCGTSCGAVGIFPLFQGVLGWFISEPLLGTESDLLWIMLAAYLATAALMPLAVITAVSLGLAGIVEASNISTGVGWSYGNFLPQPDVFSLTVGSVLFPLAIMMIASMAQAVGPTAVAMLTSPRPNKEPVDEQAAPPGRNLSMRF